MIRYILKQNQNNTSSAYQKYYAYPVVEQTMNLNDLARHMSEHEMILEGKNVKIDDLAIFSCGIRNAEGAASEDDFTVAKNIKGVKLRARATGSLSNTNLNLAATIKKASALLGNGSNTSTGE